MHTYEYKINPVVNYLLHFDYYIACDDILFDISNLLSSHACNKFIFFFILQWRQESKFIYNVKKIAIVNNRCNRHSCTY